ncbi:MAG: GNAT family N-acetyltransferase [Gammaproteobacteria bacterium]
MLASDPLPDLATLTVEPVTARDIPTINGVIERAIMGWSIAERVKRNVVPLLQYDHIDGEHLALYSGCMNDTVISMYALDPNLTTIDWDCRGALLHGLYVDPAWQRCGIGKSLINHAERELQALGQSGIIVKAERVSRNFFERCGYTHIPPKADKDYPYTYWKRLGS